MRPSERSELETFLTLFGEFDAGVCQFSDRPDLIIRGARPLIGVEHTRIFVNSPDLSSGRQRKPQERFQQQITDRARATFRRNFSFSLYLTVSFSEPSNYRARDVATVGDELAQCVSQVLNLLGPQAFQESGSRVMRFRAASIRFTSRFIQVPRTNFGVPRTVMLSRS